MLQQQVFILNTLFMIIDSACIIAAGYGAFFICFYASGGLWSMKHEVFVGTVLLTMFINNYVMGRLGLYGDRRPQSILLLAWTVLKAVVANFVCLSTFLIMYEPASMHRDFILVFAGLSFLLVISQKGLFRLYLHTLGHKTFNTRKILVVGEKDLADLIIQMLERQMSWGHEVVGTLSLAEEAAAPGAMGCIHDLERVLREYAIDEVIFALNGSRAIDLKGSLDLCTRMGITAKVLPALWSSSNHRLAIETCQGIPLLSLQTDCFNATGLLYKRVLDIVGAAVGVILFLLLYPVVAVAIKLDSRGPVLFKQQRMGQNRRVFTLYKFRTMYLDAETRKRELLGRNEMEGAMFKLKDDPRITGVGRFLRRTSIDEVPQFINVLKGEMSLVGTRPPTLEEVALYQPEHLRRISAKPGITGLWQVSGRNKIHSFEKVVALDCQYLERWRFFDDIKILLKTVFVVLQRKGAL